MRKQVNVLRYIGVLFLTVLIFSIGIFVGGSVEQLRVESLYTQLSDQDLEYQNILTENNYLDYLVSLKEENNNLSCSLIKGAYETSISNLDLSRLKLENYINTASSEGEDEFYRLKSHYENIQINYWILANKIAKLCEDNFNLILYFYADDETCPECEDQGVHLNYVKQKLKDDVLIFSFDSQKEGSVKILSQKYSISDRTTPVVIINEEVYGFVTNQDIFDILNITD